VYRIQRTACVPEPKDCHPAATVTVWGSLLQSDCAGSKGKAKVEGESEDDVPFMAQEERRPLHRVRKTMQLLDVDSKLRDMRFGYSAICGKPCTALYLCNHMETLV